MYELNPINFAMTNRALGALSALQAAKAPAVVGVADLIRADSLAGITGADSFAQSIAGEKSIAGEICVNLGNLAVPLKGQTIDLEHGHADLTARTDPFIDFLNRLPDTDFDFKKNLLLRAIGIYNPNTRIHSISVAAYAHVIGNYYISPLAVPLRAPDLEIFGPGRPVP